MPTRLMSGLAFTVQQAFRHETACGMKELCRRPADIAGETQHDDTVNEKNAEGVLAEVNKNPATIKILKDEDVYMIEQDFELLGVCLGEGQVGLTERCEPLDGPDRQ